MADVAVSNEHTSQQKKQLDFPNQSYIRQFSESTFLVEMETPLLRAVKGRVTQRRIPDGSISIDALWFGVIEVIG